MYLNREDVLKEIYFSAHAPGSVDLIISDGIRAGRPIVLSAAAAEELLTNLAVNTGEARAMVQRGGVD